MIYSRRIELFRLPATVLAVLLSTTLVFIPFALSQVSASSANAATAKAGGSCASVGLTAVVGAKKFTCVKSGSRFVWDKGVSATTSKPQSKPTTNQTVIAVSDVSKFSSAETCKLKTALTHPNHAGFPRTVTKIPTIGSHKAIAIFVEFTDLPSQKLAMDEWKNNQIPTLEKFLNEMSYGKLTYKVDVFEKFFKINKSVLSYNLDTDHDAPKKPNADFYGLVLDSIRAADPDVDFSQYEFINVVMAPTNKVGFEGAMSLPGTMLDGKPFNEATFGSVREYVNDPTKKIWLLHEVGHLMGLMHPVNTNPRENPDGYPVWDAMVNGVSAQPEFLSWHRFMLDWFSDSQVKCVDSSNAGEYVVKVSSLSSNNTQTKMLTVKLSETKTLVVESRRSNSLVKLAGTNEGILAYTVDQTVKDYLGAFKFIYDKPSRANGFLYATMKAGSKVSVGKVNLTVLRNDKDGDYVKVTIQ
jgi:M6 family metalloprotease-like protein